MSCRGGCTGRKPATGYHSVPVPSGLLPSVGSVCSRHWPPSPPLGGPPQRPASVDGASAQPPRSLRGQPPKGGRPLVELPFGSRAKMRATRLRRGLPSPSRPPTSYADNAANQAEVLLESGGAGCFLPTRSGANSASSLGPMGGAFGRVGRDATEYRAASRPTGRRPGLRGRPLQDRTTWQAVAGLYRLVGLQQGWLSRLPCACDRFPLRPPRYLGTFCWFGWLSHDYAAIVAKRRSGRLT